MALIAPRGFGIDASVATATATDAAVRVEELGFGSFWVNGSPPPDALDSLSAAAEATGLDLGVGVIPLTRLSAGELVAEIRRRRIPQQRLWLGIGSARNPGGLAEVREAVALLRAETEARIVVAAVGPRMTEVAGEIGDAVLYTWWTAALVAQSATHLVAGAARAGRPIPAVASYIRCALLPEAEAALHEKAVQYDAIPRYAEVFARTGITAADTVVVGADRERLADGIAREEGPLDVSIIRAIGADDSAAAIIRVAEATAP